MTSAFYIDLSPRVSDTSDHALGYVCSLFALYVPARYIKQRQQQHERLCNPLSFAFALDSWHSHGLVTDPSSSRVELTSRLSIPPARYHGMGISNINGVLGFR